MYDTSPLAPFKGETKPFLHVGFDTKALESLFDLHPSFETSLDLSDYVTGVSNPVAGGGGGGGAVVVGAVASPPGVPESAVVTSPVASSTAELLTLSSAATSQHLAEIERQQPGTPLSNSGTTSSIANNNNNNSTSSSTSAHGHHHHPHHPHHHHHHHHPHFLTQQQQTSPGPSVPSTPSPVSHHPPHLPLHPHPHPQPHHHHPHHHQPPQQQQQQLQGYPPSVLSPSLSVDDVSQAFSDDSCVFMPEYEQLAPASNTGMAPGGGQGVGGVGVVSTCTSGAGGEQWGDPFYSGTVKTEVGLAPLTACSLEASLPGFTSSTVTAPLSTTSPSSSSGCKMEYEAAPPMGVGAAAAAAGMPGGQHYGGGLGAVSPAHSVRTLSESSTATTSTLPDSPGPRGSPRGRPGPSSGGSGLGKGGSKRRQVPKGSEEYKEKRARNNVAVRKSRAKAKEKQRMTEARVKELTDLNESLQKKVDMLTKELTVLRRLFVDVGTPLPDDLSKLLPQS